MLLNRISSNPEQMNGQPYIRGMRLTVCRVLELLATYRDRQELFQEFPELAACSNYLVQARLS